MKIRLEVKDPDAAWQIINFHCGDDDVKRDQFSKKYFEYGEYFTIEIDAQALTGKILKRQ